MVFGGRRGFGKRTGNFIGTVKALCEIKRWVPSQPVSQLAGAEFHRFESGLKPARNQKTGKLDLAPEDSSVDPIGQMRDRDRQPVRDRDAVLATTVEPNVFAEITPGTDLVVVDNVECFAGRPGVFHRLGETVVQFLT